MSCSSSVRALIGLKIRPLDPKPSLSKGKRTEVIKVCYLNETNKLVMKISKPQIFINCKQ